MAQIRSEQEYRQHYQQALEDPNKYWDSVARELEWFKPWSKVQSGDFHNLELRWFDGGQTNIAYNCLDRHLAKRKNKKALLYIPNDPKAPLVELTYSELLQKVSQMAHTLAEQGVKKGDRVCLYMGMVPELLISVLACARIGAIHSVVFGGFSAMSLSGRIHDCGAKFLLTNDGSFRGDKIIDLKAIVDEALKDCPSIAKVIVHRRTSKAVAMQPGRDVWLHDILSAKKETFSAVPMESEDPLFILYTSGSTGKPKGLLHTTGGYMVYAYHTFQNIFQMSEDDIYWCSADIGWITGHTYLTYGPLLNGATTVMFEGVPTWPDAGRFWQEIDRVKVTHFYTAPTAIRALEAFDLSFVTKQNLSSLKILGSVGEPINEEAWQWYHKNVGKERCPIVDTWWQTETGGIMISALGGVTPIKPTFATLPFPGTVPVLVDASGKEITTSAAEGNLCLNKPWPGIARTVWGDHERYRKTYFSTYPGRYFTGDGARRDEKGNYRITGRVDDVINVSGHRIGTAEVENAINEHASIIESAVVGFPHPIKGQGLMAFAIPTKEAGKDQGALLKDVNAHITKVIGALAKLDRLVVVSGLPKTRSGKIMRRILRKVAEGDVSNLGDTSTLLNPEVVDELLKLV